MFYKSSPVFEIQYAVYFLVKKQSLSTSTTDNPSLVLWWNSFSRMKRRMVIRNFISKFPSGAIKLVTPFVAHQFHWLQIVGVRFLSSTSCLATCRLLLYTNSMTGWDLIRREIDTHSFCYLLHYFVKIFLWSYAWEHVCFFFCTGKPRILTPWRHRHGQSV